MTHTPTADVLLAIEELSQASRFGLVDIHDVLTTTGLPPKQIHDALLRLYQQGAIELRPESSVTRRLSAEVKAASPKGPRGESLTTIRLEGAMQPNPPWADKAILASWPKALRFAKQHSLPTPLSSLKASRKPTFKEYGCGFFGCVYPTADDDVVFKVSSDPDEVDFIYRTTTLGKSADLDGLVNYYAVLPIAGERRGNELAVIWREAARDAGNLDNHTKGNADLARFAGRLTQAVWLALGVKNDVKKHRKDAIGFLRAVEQWMPHVEQYLAPHVAKLLDWKKAPPEFWDSTSKAGPAFECAMNIGAYALVCEAMAAEGPGELVGKTMISLLRQGIVVADVHTKNVGLCPRHGGEAWVITDPGNQVLVNPMAPAVDTSSPWIGKVDKKLAANGSDQEFLHGAAKYGPASALVIMPTAIPSYLAYKAYLKRRQAKRSRSR